MEPIRFNDCAEPSVLLAEKLAALRARLWVVRAGTGLALAAVVGVELLGLMMFLDWWVELPWTARLGSLLLQAAICLTLLTRYAVLPWLRRPDDEAAALMVERAQPAFGQRLIAAVQLTRPGGLEPGASTALARATVDQAERLAEPLDFREIIPVDRTRRLGWLALAVVAAGAAALLVGGTLTADLLRRAFLSTVPVPRKTQVLVAEGDRLIGRGDDVRLVAEARGVVPAQGAVELRMAGRRPLRFSMEAEAEQRRRFVRLLENVQEDFTYVIILNDGRSGPHRVQVRPRPAVRAIEAVQEYPAYTGLGTVPRSTSDLSLLAGSVLRLALEATQPIARGQLRLVGTNYQVDLELDPQNPARLRGVLAIPGEALTGFAVHLVDTQGMASAQDVVYRIQIVPDRAPEVRLTYPERKEELVTRGAQLLVGLEAADDFALASVRLRYRADTGAAPPLDPEGGQTVELELGGLQPGRIERRFFWDLAKTDSSEGTLLEYWVEARDNNQTTGPGIGQSEHRWARIVSQAEKRADLLNRAGDIFSGIADATEDQEELNRRLGEIILEKTGP